MRFQKCLLVGVAALIFFWNSFQSSSLDIPATNSEVSYATPATIAMGRPTNDLSSFRKNNVTSAYSEKFWREVWEKAAENQQRLAFAPDQTATFDRNCPKVFIYDLPPQFQDVSHDEIASLDYSFGSMVPGWNGSLRETDQFSFAVILEHRIRQPGSCYYTDKPEEADLFFIPLFSKPKIELSWINLCRKFNATTLVPELAHLTEETACQHFMVLSKGHFVGRPCKGWFWDPLPIFNNSMRIAYSHVPAVMGKKPSFRGRALDPETTARKHPNLISVPYPSSLHATSREQPLLVAPGRPRKFLMSFVGSYQHGDIDVRRRIRDACRGYDNPSICPSGRSRLGESAADLLVKQESVFCLEPVGDSPWRKSLSDSIVFGCIPVLFSNDTDDVAPWFWGRWKHQARVIVDRSDFVKGKVDLYELLSSIPDGLLQLMQGSLAKYGRNFQYSLMDDEEDGIDLLLRGMKRHGTAMKDKGLCT